ncbi:MULTISPECIES: formate dehydrogenase accessory sulfurtransferase FdhD [unclassified Halanaerobium]|uniref:formate dehydrogenase accessory sulfurtransferase FdhD n=1 Tax=unclassified Halanaerobium TaxID=2641197 RepID=UPI000DF22829|nr:MULTISPECIES: formate dehydrogenase accessory sulfurtransferase FdhD [unclassified Halanaerobium]RCW40618.1 FdhD protein [Halanaerobium sp. MA284_MarDTE_T2]RCW87992.1 FdhD protein [Halanaerobium sp. DL-01]
MSLKEGLSKLNICEEVPVELNVNEKKLLTFMCTPQNLNELAVGYLYNKGLIQGIDDIMSLAACEDLKIINIKSSRTIAEAEYSLNSILVTGCGSNSGFKENFYNLEKINSDLMISLENVKKLTIEMLKKAVIYKKTGGVHCSAISDQDELLIVREDVGRHNAVDKVVGRALFEGIELAKSIIITTGRISSDMILKAVSSRIPIIISRSIPSSLALEIAEEIGITIIGRAVSKKPIVYTHEDRILTDEKIMVYHNFV